MHFHGGGFVAQTSKSHEPYLKSWAQELGAPIISIDYSLAPEAPFPRALEECFFAYCWAIKHCALLGEPQPPTAKVLASIPQPGAEAADHLVPQASASCHCLPLPQPAFHLSHFISASCHDLPSSADSLLALFPPWLPQPLLPCTASLLAQVCHHSPALHTNILGGQ